MFRFLFLALPLVLALIAGAHFVFAALGWSPSGGLPARTLFGGWLLEAVGLTALFLLIQARGLSRFVAGLGAAWTAWLFRGPILVVTVAGVSRVPPSSWWRLTLAWFVLYTICGLVLGALAPAPAAGVETKESDHEGLEREPAPWPTDPPP